MKKIFITENLKQTQKLGEMLAEELRGGEIICLVGDLGAGKTTFAQGLLKGLKVKGPYTSPTFLVMKHYKSRIKNNELRIKDKKSIIHNSKFIIQNVYHIDAYRISAKDILNLGWEEMIANKNNVIIIEWAERIKKIIPKNACWIKLEGVDENKRKIIFKIKK